MNKREYKALRRQFDHAVDRHIQEQLQRARDAGLIIAETEEGLPCSKCGRLVGALTPFLDPAAELCGYCADERQEANR